MFLIIKRLESPRPKGRREKDHSISLKVTDPIASMPRLHVNGKHRFLGTEVWTVIFRTGLDLEWSTVIVLALEAREVGCRGLWGTRKGRVGLCFSTQVRLWIMANHVYSYSKYFVGMDASPTHVCTPHACLGLSLGSLSCFHLCPWKWNTGLLHVSLLAFLR